MGNASDNQVGSFFATIFAQLLTRALSDAGSTEWKIILAEPPSATLPVLTAPVQFRLNFGERLKGACYAIFSEADVALFGPGQGAATGEKSPSAEERTAALLGCMQAVAGGIPEALAVSHGLVAVSVEQVDVLDPKAVYALELQAGNPQGAAAIILLHFDPGLLASLAAAAQSPGVSAGSDKSLIQANLELVMDVELSCTLRFGQRQLTLREILDLASGSVVELDRQVDEPVELILDGRVIARGEAVIIDGNYGLRVTQVLHALAY